MSVTSPKKINRKAIATALVLLLLGIAVLSGSAVADTEVVVTSAATVGVVSLEDASGETFASGMMDPTKAGTPLVITYDPSEHELATVSILGAGFFPVSVPVENPPDGSRLAVAFTLSSEDEKAGYGIVTVIDGEQTSATTAKSSAPFAGLIAGLGIVALVLTKQRI